MSKPPNRLASYRSYSYYHVLAMCDSSQTADALAESTNLNVWEHATPDTRVPDDRSLTHDLGKYSPKKIDGAGKYVILINGSTDTAFAINQARWLSSTGASARPGDRSTSIAVEGSLTISEPKGVAFLDQVVKCCVALGVDSAQVVYVLKTFFIGFRDDQQTYNNAGDRQDFIADIPPISFITYEVTGSFTEAGGSYEMLFVAVGHGASRLPQYSKAVNGMSITAGESLEQTLKRLQDNINQNYEKYYSCVVEQIKATAGDSGPLVESLRKVKYVIEVSNDYKDTNGVKYTVTNQPQQYKNSAGCNDAAQITFPPHTSIETAIGTIMRMSPQVEADMAVGDSSTKVKYEYKIHTALESKQASDAAEGKMEYTVYYRVQRFMSPKTISYEPEFETLQKDESEIEKLRNDPIKKKIFDNIIQFDYMYTGNNTDILEFDMKVNMGMAYLQTATLASTFKTQLERAPNRLMQPAAGDVSNQVVRLGAIVQTPVFFGSQIRVPSEINSQNSSHTIQSTYTLNKHASLEVTDVTMKIIGNTQLLGTTNRASSPKHIIESSTSSFENVGSTSLQADFAYWTIAPAYVKVKIKMPRENDDFSLFTGQASSGDPRTDPGLTDYARDFWFDGYYYVVGIEHVFEGGEFSQILSMLGLPKRSAFEATRAAATRDIEISTGIGRCFDNQIGIPPTTQTTPTVPTMPPTGSTTPTNRSDANTAIAAARSLSDVNGWDQASPEVQAAIKKAAVDYGVDPITMAQFASKESSFHPQAYAAPASSAVGLYQFVQSTWNDLVQSKRVNGTTQLSTQATQQGEGTNWKPPLPSDPRVNPQLNANAAAAYIKQNASIVGSSDVGDLYLAHFMGPGAAPAIIRADKDTNGQGLAVTAVGQEVMASSVKANPQVLRMNMTVGEVRAYARSAMVGTLKNPVQVARQQPTTTPSTPSGQALPTQDPQQTKRTADQAVAAVQSESVQASGADKRPCAPGPTTSQDRPTRGGR